MLVIRESWRYGVTDPAAAWLWDDQGATLRRKIPGRSDLVSRHTRENPREPDGGVLENKYGTSEPVRRAPAVSR